MTPSDEAAQILTRLFETLARGMQKQLRPEHRAEIKRCCELLTSDAGLLPLDDLPPPRRPAAEYTTVPPEVERWKAQQQRGEG